MRQCSSNFRLITAAVTVVAVSSITVAAWRVDSVPVTPSVAVPSRPAAISLRLRDVSVDDAVAAVRQATGLDVVLQNAVEPTGPAVVYDVTVDAATPEAALDVFARQLRVGVTERLGVLTVTPGARPIGYAKGWAAQDDVPGPLAATVTGVRIDQSRAGGRERDALTVEVAVDTGPAGSAGQPRVDRIEAVDNAGRTLVAKPPEPVRSGEPVVIGRFKTEAAFDLPRPRPAKIASFRADVIVTTPRTADRLTVTGLADGPTECTLAGVQLRVGPTYLERGQATVELAVDAKIVNQNMDLRPAWVDTFDNVRVTVDGITMRLSGAGSHRDGEWYVHTFNVQPIDGRPRPKEPITSLPAQLTWDVPGPAEAVRVPVEARDLIVP